MQDQVRALRQSGVRASYLNSTLTRHEQRHVIEDLLEGALDLLYIAPERLSQSQTLEALKDVSLSLIAIDEAHCVSQWGHDFRRDYLELHRLAAHFPDVPRMALTATADLPTREEIVQRLGLEAPARIVASFDRPNIRYLVQLRSNARKQLDELLARHPGESGIVYCLSRRKVEETAQKLREAGHDALPYHAGMDAEERHANQEHFLTAEGVIMVATIAFGMGIDKPDVRFVAHLDLPKSLEGYYQETGRAGRDGEPAETLMIFGLQDLVRIRQMVDASDADEERKRIERSKLDRLLGWCEITTCRRVALLDYFGESGSTPCGNCDVCLDAPETFDATRHAQMLLSTVYRTGQRFGAAHVLDVLLGKRTEKILQRRHDETSTFGIGADTEEKTWRSILRQLVAQGFLTADAERYGALSLTERSRPLLRGDEPLVLRKDPEPVRQRRNRGGAGGVDRGIREEDRALWDALRACRRNQAQAAEVPPYVICSDATLLEILKRRPVSHAELLAINGIGPARAERYGDALLAVVAGAHQAPV